MTRDPLTDQRTIHGALRIVLVALGLALAMSSFYIAPKLTTQNAAVGQGGAQAGGGEAAGGADAIAQGQGAAAAGSAQGAGAAGGAAAAKSGGPAAAGAAGGATSCTGNNGGKTDVGVDAKSIHLAATEVQSGIGQSFLGPVRYGMQAVLQKTNRNGGVCGRQLSLTLKDDSWSAATGKQYIDNFIQSNQYFALAVVPSSEGLNAASLGHDLDNAPDAVTGGNGIPVVGSDGMLNSQYADPWIWPVAASTATSMRIMAHYEATHGAHTFAIVYNGAYKFGIEGAGAFKAQVQRDGGTLNSGCIIKLDPSQTDYNTQASSFNQNCGNESGHPVDFVALLLEPQTAETWLGDSPYLGHPKNGGGNGAAGPQPLFDQNFANKCGPTCSGMKVWTSFFPPVYPYNQQPAVQQFNSDLCQVDSNCQTDANSAFTEGGYVGMELLVAALKQAGANLTRQGLAQTLDSMTFKSGLSADLTYHKGNHFANESMVPFIDQYGQSASFQILTSTPQSDPCRGCNDPSI
jgi:ABC-type branched-subunit amino acid transport system substrate-binding protein